MSSPANNGMIGGDLADLLDSGSDRGSARMREILKDETVAQICANRHDRIFYTDRTGTKQVERGVFNQETYLSWVNELLTQTDVGYSDVRSARTSIIEGSFDPDKTNLHGSIHVVTRESSGGDPIVTVRKQPRDIVTLDHMLAQNMMSPAMRLFLEQAIRGRLNILVSGGSGAGKTTLLKAMSWYIPPDNRIVTAEDIRELHLDERLPNVAALNTVRHRDDEGRLIRETSLVDIVTEALRMRPDRILVGETRGKEAYALTKACTTGHDGSWTTVHADTSQAAWKQLVGYVIEAGVPDHVARDRVANAFHLSIQISRGSMGQRLISEITEIESVAEGSELRRNQLFSYDWANKQFVVGQHPTSQIINQLQRHGCNFDELLNNINSL